MQGQNILNTRALSAVVLLTTQQQIIRKTHAKIAKVYIDLDYVTGI